MIQNVNGNGISYFAVSSKERMADTTSGGAMRDFESLLWTVCKLLFAGWMVTVLGFIVAVIPAL